MRGTKVLDSIEIDLRDYDTGNLKTVYIDIRNSSLSRKWLNSLNHLLANNYHLEKNYCFLGFAKNQRNGEFLLAQVNNSIDAINSAGLGYTINDVFTMDNTVTDEPVGTYGPGRNIIPDRMNWLHRYFEDLQGVSGAPSPYFNRADPTVRWHIRQLNLLCHEFENWMISWHKEIEAPEWQRPSQLMCWLNAPRFVLDENDYELFGIETLNRPLGGVFVGVNKAVGKHHWEVFNDENRDIDDLVTSTLRSQTEAAGDFDIEWANNPGNYEWQKRHMKEFREWLVRNNFDPEDRSLTIGHPQVGQVDLESSFGTSNYKSIWQILDRHLDVVEVRTTDARATYNYHWSDPDYQAQQIAVLQGGNK